MALILTTTITVCGYPGEYLRISDYHSNGVTDTVCMSLLGSKALRISGADPLPYSLQFVFSPTDHPLSELDPDTIDVTLCDDIRDLEKHARYQHLKSVLAAAKAQPDQEELTASERLSLIIDGALDDV